MARIDINDLKTTELTENDVKHVTGGSLRLFGVSANKVLLGDGSVRPSESLSLNYTKVTW